MNRALRMAHCSTVALAAVALALLAAGGCPPSPSYTGLDTVQCQLAKLTASDGAPGDYFGFSVSLSGEAALMGAFWSDDRGTDSGSAYVFRLEEGEWTEEAKLIAPDGEPFDMFGASVSISDTVAMIGAPSDDDAGGDAGAVYVYRYDGSNWNLEAKLTASDAVDSAKFGWSVSVDGDVAVIGAPVDNEGCPDVPACESGAAYVYRLDGTDWIEEAKLVASDAGPWGLFGGSVSMSGNVVAIGPRLGAVGDREAVYMYRFDGSGWMEEAKLLPSASSDYSGFGESVSVSDDVVLIGASCEDYVGTCSGAAYAFRFDGANWTDGARLTPSDAAWFDRFGESVAVMNDVAIIGAPSDDDAGNSSGAAYVFQFDGSTWVQRRKLLGLGAHAFRLLGEPVSISNDMVVIGAVGEDQDAGAVYVFSIAGDCLP